MSARTKIGAYVIDPQQYPRMFKAQRCFVNAEDLRRRGQLSCAANRYYYATIHIAQHYFGRGPSPWQNWTHGELEQKYTIVDSGAYPTMPRAMKARVKADYTDVHVTETDLRDFDERLAELVERAFVREQFTVRTT